MFANIKAINELLIVSIKRFGFIFLIRELNGHFCNSYRNNHCMNLKTILKRLRLPALELDLSTKNFS